MDRASWCPVAGGIFRTVASLGVGCSRQTEGNQTSSTSVAATQAPEALQSVHTRLSEGRWNRSGRCHEAAGGGAEGQMEKASATGTPAGQPVAEPCPWWPLVQEPADGMAGATAGCSQRGMMSTPGRVQEEAPGHMQAQATAESARPPRMAQQPAGPGGALASLRGSPGSGSLAGALGRWEKGPGREEGRRSREAGSCATRLCPQTHLLRAGQGPE